MQATGFSVGSLRLEHQATPSALERVPAVRSQQFEQRAILRRPRHRFNYFSEQAALELSPDARLAAQR
jgi:hypothetical protein